MRESRASATDLVREFDVLVDGVDATDPTAFSKRPINLGRPKRLGLAGEVW